MMMESLSIGYLNVRGLTDDKWRLLLALISADPPSPSSSPSPLPSYDLIFLAETWYVNHTAHLSHPLTLLSSPFPCPRREGRQHGGLLLLLSTRIRSLVQSYVVHEHFLSVCLKTGSSSTATISAVYLPPSLSDDQVMRVLKTMPISDIMLGDINVRYGVLFDDSSSGPPGRRRAIDGFMAKKHLVHVKPTTGKTRVDHAFLASHLSGDSVLGFSDPPVTTDHPLLSLRVTLPSDLRDSASTQSPLFRYYTKYLEHQLTQKVLLDVYSEITQPIDPLFHHVMSHPIESRDVINVLDSLLLEGVQETCERVLGSYEVSDMQSHVDDHLVDHLSSRPPSDTASAIRLFKRSQRCRRSDHLLQSRDPARSAMEDVTDYYRDMYSLPEPIQVSPSSPEISPSPPDALLSLFSPQRVFEAIKAYPLNKSPGLDSVNTTIMRSLCPSPHALLARHLSDLFKICVTYRSTPDRWNESLIFPIPKSSPVSPFIHERRPIALTVLFRRIFEKILLLGVDLLPEWSPLRVFDPGQAGFRRGFSTLTHALVSHESASLGFKVKVFLDLKQAYDRVQVPLLLQKLAGRGAPPHLVVLIRSLFVSCSSSVVVNGQLSLPFTRQCGLFQGSLLSPWLFNVFIDDLASALNGASTSPPGALFFADDIQLQARSCQLAQGMLNTMSQWLEGNGMTVNIAKCAVLSSLPSHPSLRVSDLVIPYRDTYSYLGFPHVPAGIDWTAHLQKAVTRTSAFLSFLSSSNHARTWPEWARLCIYKSFVRPLLDYGAPVLCHWLMTPRQRRRKRPRGADLTLKNLDAVQDQALLWVFGYHRPRPLLLSLSALGSLRHRFAELACRFTYHLERCDSANPARSLLDRRPALAASSLLRRCQSHPLRTLFDSSRASEPRLLLTTFLIRDRLTAISQKSKLARYILPSCRSPNSQLDSLLFIQDVNLRQQALSWRRNVFGLRQVCSKCDRPFNRGHVNRCALLPPPTDPSLSDPHYSILDEHLNRCSYQDFQSALNTLSSQLHR